ncbi:gamma carbonic anhydrase family protein [Oscillatoria laete-virens NRMC-F 0139]|nr:gamma carbonic anhydrase family protein [Oscillatoria laete-virens]MDL5054346.1 gamma carbonic anhydrase family protein [Oscillatoria laete-virens NRMC-F 0139]
MDIQERLKTFLSKSPTIHEFAFVANTASVMGDVRMGPHSSIWYSAVARGDINYIEIGEGSNVQDCACIHLADDYPAIIGKYCTIGHSAVVHACTMGDEVLVGMGAIILDGAKIGNQCIIGANCLVPQNMVVPDGSMVMGTPGKIVRQLSPEARASLKGWADKYVHVSAAHRAAGFATPAK